MKFRVGHRGHMHGFVAELTIDRLQRQYRLHVHYKRPPYMASPVEFQVRKRYFNEVYMALPGDVYPARRSEKRRDAKSPDERTHRHNMRHVWDSFR